ncbi:NmrA/HSCARG family protein [Staphylococcus sp. GDY8P85P]|uniref:NmrA/HSCARG family protein n=1 Tax=Staphylococcus sp. GDY8P85P TaxID=2804138 RepID=UPI001AEC43D0|nr:NmrA/HSCARG family protein [Staphylococcus sp. GDY8P85P]
MSKSILVIGATGKQGNAVVKQLLKDDWKVRAFTRNQHNETLTSIDSDNLEIFEGDLSHQDSLSKAMEGQYGVYSVQPIIVDNVEEELRQGKMIIQTAEQQGIEYVVYSTAGGVNRDRTGPHFEALAEIENELKASALNYTIIKPSFFMDNFLRITKVENGEIVIPEFIDRDVKFAMISSIDIAKIAANVFANNEKYNHQAIEIASDELTLKDVVKTFATVTGKPTEIKGSFSSGTAERGWLEEKGYVIDFKQMDDINPNRLTLEQWISEVNF